MKPYYEKDGQTIYHGDCRDVLPTLGRFDLVLTDPPYGIGDKWNGGGGGKKSSWAFAPQEAKSWDMKNAAAVEILPRIAGTSIIWGGNYYQLPSVRGWLIWDKKMNDGFSTGQAELAWSNIDIPVRVFRFAQCELANEGPKRHPTQKPIALMRWCMKWPSWETVVDPFLGSGTTLVACKQLGRVGVGIELEERYCEIAAKRLDNTPKPLFVDEPAVTQKELL